MTREGKADREGLKTRKLSSSSVTTPGSANKRTSDAGLIVGIGASGGGLGSFTSFLANMPTDSGLAFILIQHLSPDHKSILTDLLAKTTTMPVLEAEDGMPVDPNHVFVIPPDCTLTIKTVGFL
jgi:two-component system, chemotaxis family, CheB/CheR fusion protein